LVRAEAQGKQQDRAEKDKKEEWDDGDMAGRRPIAYVPSAAFLSPTSRAFPVSRGDVRSAVLLWHGNFSTLNSEARKVSRGKEEH